MAIDPAQIFIGGIIGFGTAGALRFWQYERDLWLLHANELCAALDDAADLATQYWAGEKGENENADEETAEKQQKKHVEELSLIGFQIKIDEYFVFVKARLHSDDVSRIDTKLARLNDALTGGNYGAKIRKSDFDRARLARATSSEVIVDLRKSSYKALSLAGSVRFYWNKFLIRYQLPIIE